MRIIQGQWDDKVELRSTTDQYKAAAAHTRQATQLAPSQERWKKNQPPTVTAEEAMRLSDQHLRSLSMLRPDHTEEDERCWQLSATKIQKLFEDTASVSMVRPKREEVQAYQRVLPMLERMITFLANMRACRDAKKKLRGLREDKRLRVAAIAVQTHLRHLQSLEEAAGRYKAQLEAIMYVRRMGRQRQIAAMAIQAQYRGYTCRKQLARRLRAVLVMQRTWRMYRLYRVVRLVVFQVRGYRRERLRLRNEAANRVQRWWRWLLPKLHALVVYHARHDASQRYLEGLVTAMSSTGPR